MALVLANRVKDTTTTTGPGTVTLSGTAPSGFQNFSTIGNGNSTYYTIAGGAEWEVGIGTYTSSGTTLSRDTVLSSSNAGSLVSFSAGSKDVFVTNPSEAFGTALIAASTTAPSSPSNGALWWDSTYGNLNIYYNDGNTAQWVVANSGPQGQKGDTGDTGAAGTNGTNGTNGADGSVSLTQNSKSADYTLVLGDAGEMIYHPASDANARTFTIPSSSVAFDIGTTVTFVNLSTSNVTIAITTDTLTLAGSGSTGSRTLAQYGIATAIKIASTQWLISGAALT